MSSKNISKVHIFWEGHKILQNLHQLFVICKYCQSNNWWRFRKILWPSRNIGTLTILILNWLYFWMIKPPEWFRWFLTLKLKSDLGTFWLWLLIKVKSRRIYFEQKPTHSWPFSSKFHHWGHAKKGGRGTKKESEPKPTAEDLDKEMDDYMKARSK